MDQQIHSFGKSQLYHQKWNQSSKSNHSYFLVQNLHKLYEEWYHDTTLQKFENGLNLCVHAFLKTLVWLINDWKESAIELFT